MLLLASIVAIAAMKRWQRDEQTYCIFFIGVEVEQVEGD